MDALQFSSPLQELPIKEAPALSQTAWLDCTIWSAVPAPGLFPQPLKRLLICSENRKSMWMKMPHLSRRSDFHLSRINF